MANKPDQMTKTMSLDDMYHHLGRSKMNLVMQHNDFKDHLENARALRIPIGARYRTVSGIERLDIAHGPIGDSKHRKMVTFTFGHSGRKISNTDVYNNFDDERHETIEGRPLKWNHLSSTMHKTDAALEKRMKKMYKEEVGIAIKEAIRKTVSAREKFIRSLKKSGYDVDAGAKRLQDLIARQKQEREKIEQRRKESGVD